MSPGDIALAGNGFMPWTIGHNLRSPVGINKPIAQVSSGATKVGVDEFSIKQNIAASEKASNASNLSESTQGLKDAQCCDLAIPSRYVYQESGEVSNLLRKTEVNGTKIRISSGHSYNRAHTSGDVRTTGLSMNDIDDAIINDLTNNVNLTTIPTLPFRKGQKAKDISILVQGHKITYRVAKLPNGELSVNTYFPTP